MQHLQEIFDILKEHKWLLKNSKCSFGQPQLEYLGHVISVAGVATDTSKIKAVLEWPEPENVKQLRGFLGLSGYYRKSIRHYGIISKSLTDLLKKHTSYVWTKTT